MAPNRDKTENLSELVKLFLVAYLIIQAKLPPKNSCPLMQGHVVMINRKSKFKNL